MPIDFSRVIQAAAEAALEGGGSKSEKGSGKEKKRGLTLPRAFLIGAGAVTAGRLIVGSRGRDMLENLQERLVEFEQDHFASQDGEEPEAAEEDFDEEEYDEEPEAEEDEDFDEAPEAEEDVEPEAEEDEEPEAEEDEDFDEEDFDEEPEAEEDDDFEEEDEEEPEPPKRRRARAGSGGRRARR